VNEIEDAERELKQVGEVLAMADRVIQISRMEQDRLSADLSAMAPEPAEITPSPEQP
jgi:hypothetical protein